MERAELESPQSASVSVTEAVSDIREIASIAPTEAARRPQFSIAAQGTDARNGVHDDQIYSFIEPPQTDVIEQILKHCGLWQARSARPPPEVDDLVLELGAASTDSSLETPDQAVPSQEFTYVDIDTFLESF